MTGNRIAVKFRVDIYTLFLYFILYRNEEIRGDISIQFRFFVDPKMLIMVGTTTVSKKTSSQSKNF